jgi:hypothetical protein
MRLILSAPSFDLETIEVPNTTELIVMEAIDDHEPWELIDVELALDASMFIAGAKLA